MDEPRPPSVFKRLPVDGTMFTLIFFVGNLLILAGSLWISNGYVAKPSFEAYQIAETQRRDARSSELRDIAVKMAEIATHMKGDEEQNRRILELEHDVRELEKKK